MLNFKIFHQINCIVVPPPLDIFTEHCLQFALIAIFNHEILPDRGHFMSSVHLTNVHSAYVTWFYGVGCCIRAPFITMSTSKMSTVSDQYQ